jgi:type IV pilus assembly protein PilM
MSFLGKKNQSSLGVDIGAGGIKMVELHKTKNRPQLWTYAIVDENLDIHMTTKHEKTTHELMAEAKKDVQAIMKVKEGGKQKPQPVTKKNDPRIDRYAELLKYAASKAKITTKSATASLPISSVFHAVMTLPKVNAKELSHHVEAKVSKMLPHPIEEMQVVHQVISDPKDTKAKDIRILVTAAPRDIVRFYTSIFQKAGFILEELETEAFALSRALVGRDTATVMIVDVGAERSNFFIIDNGIPVTHRSIQVGGAAISTVLVQQLGIEPEIGGIVKADLSRLPIDRIATDMFRPFIDPVIKEIQYSFDLFLQQTSNQNKRPEKIIMTGGSSVFPPIVSMIANYFPQMKVFVGDPWARCVYQQGLKPLLSTLGPRMGVGIGLALRGMVD